MTVGLILRNGNEEIVITDSQQSVSFRQKGTFVTGSPSVSLTFHNTEFPMLAVRLMDTTHYLTEQRSGNSVTFTIHAATSGVTGEYFLYDTPVELNSKFGMVLRHPQTGKIFFDALQPIARFEAEIYLPALDFYDGGLPTSAILPSNRRFAWFQAGIGQRLSEGVEADPRTGYQEYIRRIAMMGMMAANLRLFFTGYSSRITTRVGYDGTVPALGYDEYSTDCRAILVDTTDY